MMTLEERVNRLRPEVGKWRDELQTAIRTLRLAEDHIAVLLKMSRWCLELLEQLYQAKKKQPPQDKRLNEWIRDAQQKADEFEEMWKEWGLGKCKINIPPNAK